VPAAALVFAGCASQADLEQIQRNELQLRSMIAEDRQQMQQLQDRMSQTENLVKEMGQGGPPTRMPGRLANRRLNSLEQRLSRLEATVNRTSPEGALPPVTGGPGEGAFAPPAAPSTARPLAAPVPAPVEAAPAVAAAAAPDLNALLNQELSRARGAAGADGRLYAAGLEGMKQHKYTPAISQFALLKKRFPKSTLNEPAQYFSAVALYQQGKFDESILQFNDLGMRYPKGRFAVPALLYEARAFLKINDKIDARLTLQKLIADHGDSPQASAARELMKSLESD
jgi:TolA-binding protein